MLRKLLIPVAALTVLFGGVSACTPAGTPGAPTAVKFPFEAGKTWEYKLTGNVPDVADALSGTASLSLTEKTGNTVKFKLKLSMPPAPDQELNLTGDISGNPYSSGERQGAASTETITVPAGQFTVTHEVYSEKNADGTTTNELYYNETNGLVKMIISSMDKANKTSKFTMELK